jgi:hypothetical protein
MTELYPNMFSLLRAPPPLSGVTGGNQDFTQRPVVEAYPNLSRTLKILSELISHGMSLNNSQNKPQSK